MVDLYRDTTTVVIADRWYQSTEAIALTLPNPLHSRMIDLCHLEGNVLPQPLLIVLLDAPDGVLNKRLSARGEAIPTGISVIRDSYRKMIGPCCHAVLNTDREKHIVQEQLIKMSLKVLGAGA
jgi:thymidylate kinase